MVRFARKKNVNAWRVGFKIITTLVALWASGYALNIVYQLMNGTSSPFYGGLGLVGLTVSNNINGTITKCGASEKGPDLVNNCITGTNGTSLLAIVGIVSVIWIIFEFVEVRF